MKPEQAQGAAELKKATSLKTINTAIAGIKRSADKLNGNIHAVALMCFQHAKDYGDASPCARLVDALPLSHRRSLVINWFGQFSPVTIAKDGKTGNMKAYLKGTADERAKMWMLDEAKATPFYALPEAEREPEVPTFEKVHDNIVNFLKRTTSTVEKIENADDRARAERELQRLKDAFNAPQKAAAAG